MPLTGEALTLYTHLRTQVVPSHRVATYGDVSQATRIPIGVEGGHIGQILGLVAAACDERRLPPITSVVVRADELYDRIGRHGMPGAGYFVQEATSPNLAGRQGHNLFLPWGQQPPPANFDKDADRWQLRAIIDAHQDSVWHWQAWPAQI